jgi:SAM-dependent methyltransferase
MVIQSPKWPKVLTPLTAEQRRISDEWMKEWHEKHLGKFGAIEWFNHGYPMSRHPDRRGLRTLDIGAGIGEHLAVEGIAGQDYYAIEFRPEMAAKMRERFPAAHVTTGDCQQTLPYENASFDRILAIHVLEHLTNLPAALREIHRVLKREGRLVVVIPCEGGALNLLARRISAQRIFVKKYRMPYQWWIQSEHINLPHEIIEELDDLFLTEHRQFFPFYIPSINCNICMGLTLRPRQTSGS